MATSLEKRIALLETARAKSNLKAMTDEELDEIFADDDFDNGEEDGEIHSFYFSNPDPYAKVKPRPDDAPKREFSFDEKAALL